MSFAWKFLLPLALINLASAAIWVAIGFWGSDPKWTFTIGGVDPLGWMGSAAWVRQVVGLVVTGLINGLAFRWLLELNRRPADETPAELAQDQVFGTASLPEVFLGEVWRGEAPLASPVGWRATPARTTQDAKGSL
jgi:hypothetical protein